MRFLSIIFALMPVVAFGQMPQEPPLKPALDAGASDVVTFVANVRTLILQQDAKTKQLQDELTRLHASCSQPPSSPTEK